MTWGLWRTSIAVRLCPAFALVAMLDNVARGRPGDAYLLNRMIELDLSMLLFGAGLAAGLAAADAGSLRRRPGLRQVRLSSAHDRAMVLAVDVVPTWAGMVGAYVLSLLALCATADRGRYGWGEATLSIWVVSALALAVALGQLVGWILPRYLSPIIAGTLPYAGYFFSIFNEGAPWGVRSGFIYGGWAPGVVPDGPRILLAAAGTAAAAVVVFLMTTQAVRRGSRRPLLAAAAVLAGLIASLAVVPSGTKDAYYAKVSDQPPRCASADGVRLCVLAADGDLLPTLATGVTRYLDANGSIPGAPSAVLEEGLPTEPTTWSVGSNTLLHGADGVVWELASQHVDQPEDCPTEPPAPAAYGPWSWILADLLARQAGAEPQSPLPPELARLNEQQSREWLPGAIERLRSCQVPIMP